MNEIKRRGAHSGFMKNGYCHTDSSVSCGRVQLLRAKGVEEVHNEATLARFALGKNNETDQHTDWAMFGTEFLPDVEVVKERFEGHADAVIGTTVYELKSVTSPYVWRNVKQGKYKLSNLAQVVGYMWALNLTKGVLAYTRYENEERKETISFDIGLNEYNEIFVNAKFSGYTLEDWRQHHEYLLNDLDNDFVSVDRPVDPSSSWFAPCTFCKWNPVCDRFNAYKQTSKDFVNECKAYLEHEGKKND